MSDQQRDWAYLTLPVLEICSALRDNRLQEYVRDLVYSEYGLMKSFSLLVEDITSVILKRIASYLEETIEKRFMQVKFTRDVVYEVEVAMNG